MSVTGEFNIAGTELMWPIGIGGGYTNHPDIEVVASRLEEASSVGAGYITIGSLKLGDADGGSAHKQEANGKWIYLGGDEFHDPAQGLGYNTKSLPGPGLEHGLARLKDLLEIPHARGMRAGLSLSPHSSRPLDEMPELLAGAEKALALGADYIEFNLSCPNIPDRPAFYKDADSVYSFLELLKHYNGGTLYNRLGNRALFLKFGPMDDSEIDTGLRHMVVDYAPYIGGIVTSNTIGNQVPTLENGEPAIKVNNGKAGMSGPGCVSEGARQLRYCNAARRAQPLQIVSVLGIGSGDEAYQRMSDGADAVQAVSAFYWPDLVGKDSAGAVFDAFAKGFSDMYEG